MVIQSVGFAGYSSTDERALQVAAWTHVTGLCYVRQVENQCHGANMAVMIMES